MTRTAPVLATWLLERFGVKRQNEALIGDLTEEYQAGKSVAWYWWQTVAIAVAVPRDIREHKLLALRAMAMGWILMCAFSWTRSVLVTQLTLHWDQWSSLSQSATEFGLIAWFCGGWALIGWLVARAHRAQSAAIVLVLAAWMILLPMLYTSFYLVTGIVFLSGFRPTTVPHDALHTSLTSLQFLLVWFTDLSAKVIFLVLGGLLVRPKTQLEPFLNSDNLSI